MFEFQWPQKYSWTYYRVTDKTLSPVRMCLAYPAKARGGFTNAVLIKSFIQYVILSSSIQIVYINKKKQGW